MLKQHICGQLNGHDNLINRVRAGCDKHGISMMNYIFGDNYVKRC